MLFLGLCKHFIRANVFNWKPYLNKGNGPLKWQYFNIKTSIANVTARSVFVQCRNFTTEPEPRTELRYLVEEPAITLPNVFYALRNLLLTHFIIKPFMDKDFNIQDFKNGAIEAVCIVSNALANGNYGQLHGLVEEGVIQTLKPKIESLSMHQRKQIEVMKDHLGPTFLHQIGIISKERTGTPQRFIEITMVHIYLPSSLKLPLMITEMVEPFIANYRFIREVKKDGDSYWMINAINHFRSNAF
ncbi:uncharacterized protein LOC105697999 [Orussus abietinus]|uniref:uncharacterized protein LOC105697999 n=1 Tax=Orussus abietinus TaxID=222816 RepID=UPI000625C4F3|nr:uncharacterized protein LOC105697999 [Orussus abietinus]